MQNTKKMLVDRPATIILTKSWDWDPDSDCELHFLKALSDNTDVRWSDKQYKRMKHTDKNKTDKTKDSRNWQVHVK